VVTCYELGRTLSEAIASVRDQTQPAAEMVVVDDGSEDPYTRSVLAAIESEVTVVRLEHAGPAAARNTGIERTTSELVVLLDGDDLFSPTYLEKAGSILETQADIAFVSCGLVAFGNASYGWTPPPYTISESIGRGACGHISTVFRRGVWEAVGGFDSTLPAYEDLDFWLSALEHGFVGAVIDEPLLHYRVRRGSRYHLAISADVYPRAKKAILAKHAASAEADAAKVFGIMLDFEREIREHGAGLRRGEGELESRALEHAEERDELSAELRRRGVTPVQWGEMGIALERGSAESPDRSVHAWYVDEFLRANRSAEPGRVLEVRTDGDLPASRAEYDTILVLDALASAADPRRTLEACRGALVRGGTLLAVFPCIPPARREDLRLFTEASARTLACSVFDPADVEVSVFGNLPAAIAGAAGIEADTLAHDELLFVDRSYPVTVGVRALGRSGNRGRRHDGQRRGSASARRGRPADGNVGVALMYHRIAAEAVDPHRICTSPATFRSHMEHLRANYELLPLDELAERALAGTLADDAVAVTFDDGYLDNLEIASPILTDLHIPATFFICTERIDEEHEHWWDVVERALIADDATPPSLRIHAGGGRLELPTRSAEERQRALLALHAVLIDADVYERDAVLEQLSDWKRRTDAPRRTRRVMTTDELRELARRPGHELAAHTVHHLRLTAHDAEVCRQELVRSRADLEDLVGCTVKAVAYPYGAANRVIKSRAADLGFDTGWSVDGDVVTAHCDPLFLPRFDLSQVGEASFAHVLAQAFDVPLSRTA
jgi:peptidoglycan/xylan/chitin deacetylase (PgdA/CDA1 family)